MMSSEGSVSSGDSRVRQFGLYRSIDARTEEFLRLSRRRQIRQGCACAAVSTAITVTVVVVVIFVYQFSLNSEINIKNSLRRNWFSLINDTIEEGFETTYAKAGIDKKTLTLLPIILKALKKNVFMEEILEGQTNSSSAYDTKQTTERSFNRIMFTKNWIRVQPKLYAIAYKTSPIAYYRSSSQNMEYFTKIRKIRDYQRMINYVDKMISEKALIGSTRPMFKQETFTEKSLTKEVAKHSQNKNSIKKLKATEEIAKKERDTNCTCPTKFADILNKILSGIEKLLLASVNTDRKNTTKCRKHNSMHPISESDSQINKTNNNRNSDSKFTSTKKMFDAVGDSAPLETSTHKDDEKNDTLEFWQQESQYLNDFKVFERSTNEDRIDVTEKYAQFLTKPTESVNKIIKTLKPKVSFNVFGRNDNVSNENKSSISLIKENVYKDQKPLITSGNDIKDFQIKFPTNQELQFVNHQTFAPLEYDKLNTNSPSPFNRLEPVRANALVDNIHLINLKKKFDHLLLKEKKLRNIQFKPKPIKTSTTMLNEQTTTSQPTSYTAKPLTIYTESEMMNNGDKIDNALSTIGDKPENRINITHEDVNKEIMSVTDSPMYKNVSDDKIDVIWEELKNENIPAWKSMTPNLRPSYLEIHQKSDWKHDTQDYDFNIINDYDNNIPEK